MEPNAINCLGQIYMEGKFIDQDIGKAIKYYEKSCESDNAEAWYRMGRLLQKYNVKGDTIYILNKNIKDNRSIRQIVRIIECY